MDQTLSRNKKVAASTGDVPIKLNWLKEVLAEGPHSADRPMRLRRLTIDLPEEVHRAIKIFCAQHDVQMGFLVRCVIEKSLADNANQESS